MCPTFGGFEGKRVRKEKRARAAGEGRQARGYLAGRPAQASCWRLRDVRGGSAMTQPGWLATAVFLAILAILIALPELDLVSDEEGREDFDDHTSAAFLDRRRAADGGAHQMRRNPSFRRRSSGRHRSGSVDPHSVVGGIVGLVALAAARTSANFQRDSVIRRRDECSGSN